MKYNSSCPAVVFRNKPDDFSPQVEVSACYLDFRGKFLFLKRALGKPQENTWCVPGGKIERNETSRQAVIREVFEEIGLKLEEAQVKDVGVLFIRYPHVDFVYHMFRQDFSCFPEIQLSREHQKYCWATFEEATQLTLISGAEEAFYHYNTMIKNLEHKKAKENVQ